MNTRFRLPPTQGQGLQGVELPFGATFGADFQADELIRFPSNAAFNAQFSKESLQLTLPSYLARRRIYVYLWADPDTFDVGTGNPSVEWSAAWDVEFHWRGALVGRLPITHVAGVTPPTAGPLLVTPYHKSFPSLSVFNTTTSPASNAIELNVWNTNSIIGGTYTGEPAKVFLQPYEIPAAELDEIRVVRQRESHCYYIHVWAACLSY